MNNEELCMLIESIAKKQNRNAFAKLFQYFGPRLKAYALRTGCSKAEAEELMQETMITVWRRASSFDRNKAGVSTWIFTIVRNKRIDCIRREKRPTVDHEEVKDQSAGTEDPIEALDTKRATEALRSGLKSLPREQLIVLQKAFLEDKTHSVVAEELEIPLGTVKSRIRLALKRLRASPLVVYA